MTEFAKSPSLLNPCDLSDASDSQQTETASQVKDNKVSLGGLWRSERRVLTHWERVLIGRGTPDPKDVPCSLPFTRNLEAASAGGPGVISVVPTQLRDWGAEEHPRGEARLGRVAGPMYPSPSLPLSDLRY